LTAQKLSELPKVLRYDVTVCGESRRSTSQYSRNFWCRPLKVFVSFLGLPRRRVLSPGLSAAGVEETSGPSAGGAPEALSSGVDLFATLGVAGQSRW
jgi:hypothetical protein